jgi:hypothetical protein
MTNRTRISWRSCYDSRKNNMEAGRWSQWSSEGYDFEEDEEVVVIATQLKKLLQDVTGRHEMLLFSLMDEVQHIWCDKPRSIDRGIGHFFPIRCYSAR